MLRSDRADQVPLLLFLLFTAAWSLYLHEKVEQEQAQKHLREKNTVDLARQIAQLSMEIRIATYPVPYDARAREIVGESCDLGNYMEWAGPQLEKESQELLKLLDDERK